MNSGYKALAVSVLESAVKDIVKRKDKQRKARAILFFKSRIGEFWCDVAGVDLATLRDRLGLTAEGEDVKHEDKERRKIPDTL
jgi:hypothetical protein